MKAMILAAGEGQRMRPLTNTVPKALLPVAGKPLVEYVIEGLVRAGIEELVINLFYRGEMIARALGDGRRWGIAISYVKEPVLLETGGGIVNALPLLGDDPFVVVNADVFSDFDFGGLGRLRPGSMGHLVLVDNPDHHRAGDVALGAEGWLSLGEGRLTYAGIALLSPALFGAAKAQPFPLRDLLLPAARDGQLTGEHFRGFWADVGTPERYAALRETESE